MLTDGAWCASLWKFVATVGIGKSILPANYTVTA
jgi:hypothetical protein